jgi:hypothetical protein
MNYDLTPEGVQTSDPVIAAMFLGETVNMLSTTLGLNNVLTNGWSISDGRFRLANDCFCTSICIPYPAIKAAIEPVEGGWCYYFPTNSLGFDESVFRPSYGGTDNMSPKSEWTLVAANPITTGCTVGELRALLAAIGGE